MILILLLTAFCSGCEREVPAPPREEVHFPQGETARLAGDYEAALDAYEKSIDAVPGNPRPYFGLVESHARMGTLEEAARTLDSLNARDPRNACVHYGLGCLAIKLQDLEAALFEAEQTIALDSKLGHGQLLLGTVHYYAGRSNEALDAWSKARRIYRKAGDRKYEAWALNRTALVRRELGQLGPALDEFEQALRIQYELGERQAQQLILGNIGLTQIDLGDLVAAMNSFDSALAIAREVKDLDSECWNLTNLSFLYNLTAQSHRAIAYADSAISLSREAGSRLDEVSGLMARATASLDLGDPVGGLKACRRALSLSDSLIDPRHRGSCLATMARCNLNLGRLGRARDCYVASDSIFRALDIASGSWEAQIGLATIAVNEGDTANAITLAEQTLAACERAGHAEFEEFLVLLLSDLRQMQREFPAALALAERAVALSRRDGRRMREALALAKRAEIHHALGKPDLAEDDAVEACRIAQEIRGVEVLLACEVTAGDILRDRDPDTALKHYRTAMEASESIQRKLRIEEFRAAHLEREIGLYRRAAELLVDLGRDEEAFVVSERSRARAFRDLLTASPTPILPRVAEPLIGKIRRKEERLCALQASRARIAATSTDLSKIRNLDRDIKKAKTEWEELRAQILLDDPHYGVVAGGTATPAPREVLAALAPNEALVEYLLGSSRSFCFLAMDGRIQAVPLKASAAEIAASIENLCGPLQEPRSLGTLIFDVGVAERLRRQLFDPLEPLLEGIDRLIIVPDGPLYYLPFEALVLESGQIRSADTLYASFARTEFLGDRYAIAYLPSSSLLVSTERSRREKAEPNATLLAIGRPPRARSSLPHSEQEVRRIANLFPDATVKVGTEVSESSFKELAGQFRWIHISSHGFVDETVPLYSGLQLAADSAGTEDGVLHAYEVLTLPLRCELVTLSACRTGLGRLYAGEGLLGLTRAFFYAGARQAVVSLWSVNDASTSILMERFYANLGRGLGTAEALQDAKRMLRRTTKSTAGGRPISYAHPFFWAPFVFIRAGPMTS